MNNATAAQVIAIQTAMHVVMCELLVLLPKDQRALLRERLQEQSKESGELTEYEPQYTEFLQQQWKLWDQLLGGASRA